MEKVYLSEECKRILNSILDGRYDEEYKKGDENALSILEQYGFIKVTCYSTGLACNVEHTNKGFAYKAFNPKLKNPSIFDDIKYIITTSIALLALITSIVALIKAW